MIMIRLTEVYLDLSEAQWMFEIREVLIVRHIYRAYRCKPSSGKVDPIWRMMDFASTSKNDIHFYLKRTMIFYKIMSKKT